MTEHSAWRVPWRKWIRRFTAPSSTKWSGRTAQLELIASENFTSEAVLEATGSVFTNKYAEGYPGKRYYGGCEFTDVVENLARDRAKTAVPAPSTPTCSRTPARRPTRRPTPPCCSPGDTILGLNLAHGGHLTHGHKLNFSGKTYNVVPYGVRKEDERIDYDELARLAEEHEPKMIVAGGQRLSAHLDFARFRADRRRGGRAVPGGHGALLRAGGGGAASQSVRVCRYRHLHHPQDAARPARRHDSVHARSTRAAIDKTVFPGMQGGPLVHVIAAKAVCFLEAMQPELRGVPEAGGGERASAGRRAYRRPVSAWSPAAPTPTVLLLDVFSKGHARQGGRGGARPRPHHREQERHTVRHQSAR